MPKTISSLLLAFILFVGFVPAKNASAQANQWSVDKRHSAVNFQVKHFFTPVNGTFTDYEIDLAFDPDNLGESSISVTIDVSSVDTRNERRNNHLLTTDFFDAETYPQISFVSERIVAAGDNNFVAHGQLTIRDVTKDFELPFTLLGIKTFEGDMAQRMGSAVAGFTAEASIDRGDYGVGSGSWAATAVVGARVDISVAIEAKQQ